MTIDESYKKRIDESFKTKLNIFLFIRCVGGVLNKIILEDFLNYQIMQEDIVKYAGQYYQYRWDEKIDSLTIREIKHLIDDWKKNNSGLINTMKTEYERLFKTKILPYDKFERIFNHPDQKCHYCHITLNDIEFLIDQEKIFKKRDTRGFSIEIDRKRPNEEYSEGNIVLCCYWCNNAKTDEFTDGEFESIANGIRAVWVKRGIKHLDKSFQQ